LLKSETGIERTVERKMLFKNLTRRLIAFLWQLTPGIIGSLINKQFFTPQRHHYTQTQLEYLNTGNAFEIKVNDDTIKCWKWGKGPMIIFIHGWNGFGLQFYPFIKSFLNKGFSVLIFDSPGHGLSPGNTCSYFQMTDVLRQFITSSFTDKIAGLIGHSFGAAAIVNSLEKEQFNLPAVLISPAIQLNKIIDHAFSQYQIPKGVYSKLIGEYEKKYKYSFSKDDPINLISWNADNYVIIHDQFDPVIPFSDSKQIIQMLPKIKLMAVKELGHKKILKNETVIHKSVNYFHNFYL